jgi:anti-anti-sigma regulatory factor
MPLETAFIPAEDRLDLTVHGRLDLTLTHKVKELLTQTPPGLRTCVIDLTGVERTFDSGLALLWVLDDRFSRLGVRILVLIEDQRLFEQVTYAMRHALLKYPQDSAASVS